MASTTLQHSLRTQALDGQPAVHPDNELLRYYDGILAEQRISWTVHHRLSRRLGSGGQGVVYLTNRRGADQFTLPVAVKVFSPSRYETVTAYEDAMGEIAKIAARVAQIQQDNLIDVHNFVDRSRIRLMEMEWVDGYDLRLLLTDEMLERARQRVSNRRWIHLNDVIVTRGPIHPRLKPGIAIAILRDCLAALAALHREGIVHGDVKPSNIMVKRTGNAKIIDIGSAFDVEDPPSKLTCTPTYAPPEVLEGAEASPRSDLASLGYVLIELLAGSPLFAGLNDLPELLQAKRTLVRRLSDILPADVVRNELLMNLCQGLVAPDPMRRFPNAEAADLVEAGAASFHRQLVKVDLASEYDNEIRLWLEELEEPD